MTDAVRSAVERSWGVRLTGDGVRLTGGEESASYRFGPLVVRIGPTWRSSAELEWSYAIAARIAASVPEVTEPRPTLAGGHVLRVDDRPVSVWPYAEGTWADPDDEAQATQAARLLARLHRACARLTDLEPRPGQADLGWLREPHPDVVDAELDHWLAEFQRKRIVRHPLHGDVYRANVLVRSRRIVALLDWDDVSIGPPEQELAWAASEWSGITKTLDPTRALRFVDTYVAAGGTADRIGEAELTQLVRGRIRMEVTYSHATGQWGASADPEEAEYEARQLRAFRELSLWPL
ncbi:hypothetical protein GCM10027569_39170 [Flindersiella endophytica]